MLGVPFLTDLDSRAAVKGSRDPLGIQQIWARLGRRVVGNLTTVSNSLRDFTTLLLGYYFAEQLSHELGSGTELTTFLKWEQLVAYSRAAVNKDFAFRGTERVRKNLNEGSRVTISDDRSHQILGDQKTYGLWGLYTMPSRASGLVDGDPARLTAPALDLVTTTYLPVLAVGAGRDARQIRDVLRQKSRRVELEGKDQAVVQAIAKVCRPDLQAVERDFYRRHLLHGGPGDETEGLQRQLSELLDDTLSQENFSWSPAAVGELGNAAKARGEPWHPLAHRLHRIQTSETVLAPVSVAFSHILGFDNKSVGTIVKRLQDQWGTEVRTINVAEFSQLRAEIGGTDSTAGDRWVTTAEALSGGDYGTLIDLLILQNKTVMAARGGAPWVEKRDGKLHVRFRDERGSLPTREQLPSLWRFPYFLDSLRSVAAALQEDQDG
jgi:hypothetical protein